MHMDDLGGTFFLGSRGGLRLEPELRIFRDEWGYMVDTIPQGIKPTPWLSRLRREVQDFYASIREGTRPPIDPQEVLMTNVIFDGIQRSFAAGGVEVSLVRS